MHFTGKTAALLDDPATAFGPVAEIFRAADFGMINLETAVTTRGTAAPKSYTFRAPPSAFDAIRLAGVDAVAVANNHALDYGQVGFADTLAAARQAGVAAVGGGANAKEAYAPWITTIKGVRIGVLAFSQVGELVQQWNATSTRPGMATAVSAAQIEQATEIVREVRGEVDVLIVYMHWGQEVNQCPTGRQKETAKAFAAAGATMIVGTHAHILQGEGWLDNTYVAYGLSNFIWYSNSSPSFDTGLARITLTGDRISNAEFVPAKIDRAGLPIPVTGSEATRIKQKMAALRECTGLAPAPGSSQRSPSPRP